MTTRNRLMLLPLSALLLLLGAGAPGCGGASATVESLCAKCGATGSNLDECLKAGNTLQSASEKAGCVDQFQAFVDCGDEKGSCEGDRVAADKVCKGEFDALEACGVHF